VRGRVDLEREAGNFEPGEKRNFLSIQKMKDFQIDSKNCGPNTRIAHPCIALDGSQVILT
jgi:hypothetical protein